MALSFNEAHEDLHSRWCYFLVKGVQNRYNVINNGLCLFNLLRHEKKFKHPRMNPKQKLNFINICAYECCPLCAGLGEKTLRINIHTEKLGSHNNNSMSTYSPSHLRFVSDLTKVMKYFPCCSEGKMAFWFLFAFSNSHTHTPNART